MRFSFLSVLALITTSSLCHLAPVHAAGPCDEGTFLDPASAAAEEANRALILVPEQKQFIPGLIQSRFIGPTQIKVWRHWQQSWNVENTTSAIQFELIRGLDASSVPYVLLRYKSQEAGLRAVIRSKSFDRKSEWEVASVAHPERESLGQMTEGWAEFTFKDASFWVDQDGVRAVTDIDFEIYRGNERVYGYELQPMYARGRDLSYWNNKIDSYSAHGGSGVIQVSTTLNQGLGWDKWKGTQVRPVLDYIERNTTEAGAEIGLHRHEQNQEIWSVERGRYVVINGVAERNGGNYPVQRKWASSGTLQDTEEFQAQGGWMETRFLTPGQFSIIVPSSANPNSVYHHGIRSLSDGVFWTLGAKN